MFLRSHGRSKDGKEHTYWSLVETIRTAEGPRQRTLCYLGELNGSAQARWLKTIEAFNEQGEVQQLKLFPSHIEAPADDPQVARVLIHKVRLERTREFGACYVGWKLWQRLQLDVFYAALLDGDRAEVGWSQVAAVLAINRLCAPGSELSIERHWYTATALEDLLDIAPEQINDTRLYRCLDKLLPGKTQLEQHLKQKYGELFGAQFDVLLYDLTSTYVEGAASHNPAMRRGYSRDHRPDCQQLVLAVVANSEGFPLSWEVFNGNRGDVTTLEAILRLMERKYGKARRIWVFDRGIVSEENLEAIRRRGGQYLVGTPRSKLKEFAAELLNQQDWQQVRPEVEVKRVGIPTGEETYILCRTQGRKEKEQAMRSRFVTRIEAALSKLEKRVAAGKLKDRDKIQRQLGGVEARHPQVADLYEMKVVETEAGLRVQWQARADRQSWRQAREGAYLLRTNLSADDPQQLWSKYMQLVEVEAVFRALKSELAIRPIYHQLERRVKAHVLVAFLGYALWVTLKHLLRRNGSEKSPVQALHILAGLHSADIVLPTTDGREIRLRRITEPSTEQKQLLHQLNIELPDYSRFTLKCSADSATA